MARHRLNIRKLMMPLPLQSLKRLPSRSLALASKDNSYDVTTQERLDRQTRPRQQESDMLLR